MFDVQKLLGAFLGVPTSAAGADEAASSRDAKASHAGSLQETVGTLLRTHGATALAGGLAGGLAAHLFGGRDFGKAGDTALKVGGAALIAGLAYRAYQNYQDGEGGEGAPVFDRASAASPAPPSASSPTSASAPTSPPPAPASPPAARQDSVHSPDRADDAWACVLLAAMIAAAKADGYIDASEEQEIFGRLEELDLDPEELNFVRREMQKPQTIDELVAGAATPEAALQIYTASVLAIDPDHPAEQAYLNRLAISLSLPSALTAEVRRTSAAANAGR